MTDPGYGTARTPAELLAHLAIVTGLQVAVGTAADFNPGIELQRGEVTQQVSSREMMALTTVLAFFQSPCRA